MLIVVIIWRMGSAIMLVLPIMRTAAAAKVEILVSLLQVLEWGKGAAGGGGGGGDLTSKTVEEEEEGEDAAHFDW